MIEACKKFLYSQVTGLMLDSHPFPFTRDNVFFEPMPRDFLASLPFAACCLVLKDERQKDGGIVSNIRSGDFSFYTRTVRRFERRVLFRVILHAESFGCQWGVPEFPGMWNFKAAKGLIDLLGQQIASRRVIADEFNHAVKVELRDAIHPLDSEQALQMLESGRHEAVLEVEFKGGIYVQKQIPVIRSVDIQPEYQIPK